MAHFAQSPSFILHQVTCQFPTGDTLFGPLSLTLEPSLCALVGRNGSGKTRLLRLLAGLEQPLETMCPYVYENAVSPHLAARLEGGPVELDVVKAGFDALAKTYDLVTMEGSGGILCPLRVDETGELWLEDVVKALNLGCLVVADAGLGTINSTVLTVEYLRARNIPVKGIILNHYHPGDVMEEDNRLMCEKRAGVPVVACVADGDRELNMDGQALAALYE